MVYCSVLFCPLGMPAEQAICFFLAVISFFKVETNYLGIYRADFHAFFTK